MDSTSKARKAVANMDSIRSHGAGTLKVSARVHITDIFGNARVRNVSLGTAHGIEKEEAENLVASARRLNDNDIQGRLTFFL